MPTDAIEQVFNNEVIMTKPYISTLFVATLIVTAAMSISVGAQTARAASPSVASRSATISLSIAVPIKHIPLGQKPWVSLTVKNLGSEEINCPWDRIYVEGPKGEPPTTLIQRQITDRLKPGEPVLALNGYVPSIAPGDSFTMKYDLSGYYDLKEPGKYTVYIEVVDKLAAKAKTKTDNDYWVRSPVATFEVEAPTP
jgi:hypothetical protein